ncbi:MAG: pantoate--beta-alanine ligase [Planctomycetota bacterium]|nr:pantoate--beta-alanine ligase [Planctomycetota bacterium]
MQVISSADELRLCHGGAFVPTMGALHAGHLSLIRRAAECPAPVVVSIFVNPTQFGPNEDYQRYPRPLEADLAAAEQAGAEFAFVPEVETVYPPDEETPVPPLPEAATRPGLEDAHRPGHLAGVCQVVARLFDLLQPRYALFGEKDYQQLLVIRAMSQQERQRWSNLRIVAHETVRDDDGMALSSRNEYLTKKQRRRGLGLSRALRQAQESENPQEAEETMRRILDEHDLQVDYAVARDAATLLPTESFARPARALIAGRVDEVRLIDNMAIPP